MWQKHVYFSPQTFEAYKAIIFNLPSRISVSRGLYLKSLKKTRSMCFIGSKTPGYRLVFFPLGFLNITSSMVNHLDLSIRSVLCYYYHRALCPHIPLLVIPVLHPQIFMEKLLRKLWFKDLFKKFTAKWKVYTFNFLLAWFFSGQLS